MHHPSFPTSIPKLLTIVLSHSSPPLNYSVAGVWIQISIRCFASLVLVFRCSSGQLYSSCRPVQLNILRLQWVSIDCCVGQVLFYNFFIDIVVNKRVTGRWFNTTIVQHDDSCTATRIIKQASLSHWVAEYNLKVSSVELSSCWLSSNWTIVL